MESRRRKNVGTVRRGRLALNPLAVPFVVGHARSGTTLLRAMLDSHPELAVPWESYFIPQLWPQRHLFERQAFSAPLFLKALAETPHRHWRMDQKVLASFIRARNPQSFQDAVRCVYVAYALTEGKPRWGDKTPDYMINMNLIAGLLPEVKFIHIIRDGRDVATSLMQVSWGVQRTVNAAMSWRWRVSSARTFGRSLGPQRYLEVCYEDLVEDPESVLAPVCRLIDLDFDPLMLRYHERADALLAAEPSPQFHHRLHLAPTSGLRDWRTEMRAEDLEVFQLIAGDLLTDLGYPLARAGAPASRLPDAWRGAD